MARILRPWAGLLALLAAVAAAPLPSKLPEGVLRDFEAERVEREFTDTRAAAYRLVRSPSPRLADSLARIEALLAVVEKDRALDDQLRRDFIATLKFDRGQVRRIARERGDTSPPPKFLIARDPDHRRPAPLPKIAPGTSIKDLLPTPPSPAMKAVYVGEDLAEVPEVALAAQPEWELSEKWAERMSHAVAAALHLNAKEEDGYIREVIKSRADIKGLPFILGDDARLHGPAGIAFGEHAQKHWDTTLLFGPSEGVDGVTREIEGDLAGIPERQQRMRQAVPAIFAVLSQRLADAPAGDRVSLARLFGRHKLAQTTRELARMAVYSFDRPVREAALEALASRGNAGYDAILIEALRYPWPAVARNATEAVVKLGRRDLALHLVALLEEGDPRLPRETKGGATTTREVVRIAHRNCMLCHAASETEYGILTGRVVELRRSSLPVRSGYQAATKLLVRIDVTYLRQDFSLRRRMQEDRFSGVKEVRLDYIIRRRELTKEEAADLRKRLDPPAGKLSPYQQAALDALRKWSGRDFGADAAGWRKYLGLLPTG